MERGPFRFLRSRWAALAHDVLWVPAALLLAYWLRFNLGAIPETYLPGLFWLLAVAMPIQVAAFCHFGLYRGIWRFASIPDLIRILKAVAIGTLCTVLVVFVLQRLEGVPRSVLVLYPVILALGLATPRLLYRGIKDHHLGLPESGGRRVLIVGAGRAGEMLLRDMLKNRECTVVGFLDDDVNKRDRDIHGIRVLGNIDDLPDVVRRLQVEVVLLAMPSARPKELQKVVKLCQQAHVTCRTLPSMAELAGGKITVSRLRHVQIEDLLGRESVVLDNAGLHAFLEGKCVLVTGAGGSIGSELCRQIAGFSPARLIMVDNGEYNLYRIEQELRERGGRENIECLLGDVRDEQRMRWLFSTFKPQVVFHAAAYKHVPLVEENPAEGVKTNVLGSKLIADLAVEFGADKFVLVSTDKAVNPTNIMGATKRIAEIYCQNLNDHAATRFVTTRFGNVLGSTGSVVPKFREQIELGGPVTVTHPEISRYFMTIPEAVSLILQAGAMGEGGEIFVLDMGEPVKIVELAEQMIRLSGLEPYRDIDIVFTGLRPGEKMHEELLHATETMVGTAHPKLLLASCRQGDWSRINALIASLEPACHSRDVAQLRLHLRNLVPEFSEAPHPEAVAQDPRGAAPTLH